MEILDNIIEVLEREGVVFTSDAEKENVKKDIYECIEKGWFQFIVKDNRRIGFITWHEVWKDRKLHIFVNNMIVFKEFRNRNNLLNIRRFFKDRYPERCWAFWHSRKKKKFIYEKRKYN
jgi:hypothetical protein